MGQLTDKVVVVTGASRGIGRVIAQRFFAEGATVTIGSRSDTAVAGVAWVETDVADPTSADALIAHAVANHGRLDVLVNNAGVQLEKPVTESTDDDYEFVMGVNVRGTFNCCRAAIPHLASNGGGSIINIGSVAGQVADQRMALYNASKGAVHALTRSIAIDHGRDGVRCNAIAPGWIETELAEAAFAEMDDPVAARADAIARHPVPRLGDPADVAGLAVWLAGDAASFVNGSVFTIDGGLTAGSPIRDPYPA